MGRGQSTKCTPPGNFKTIEATAKGLKGCKLCPRLFCLRVAKWTNNVLSRGNHNFILFFIVAILDFSISPKLQKTIQIGSNLTKTTKKSTWCINGSDKSKCRIFAKKVKKSKFGNNGCQHLVARETSIQATSHYYIKLLPDKFSEQSKFGDVFFYIKEYSKSVQAFFALTPWLNRVKVLQLKHLFCDTH